MIALAYLSRYDTCKVMTVAAASRKQMRQLSSSNRAQVMARSHQYGQKGFQQNEVALAQDCVGKPSTSLKLSY